MCLLLVASPNSTPKRKDLEGAACNNPHGFGWAILTKDGVITGKGMSSRKVINKFLEVRKQYPNSYAMFHARYATHGVKNDDNCHPFKVKGNVDTYLAHNGILDVHITAGDRRSDSRIFAEDILPAMGGVTGLDNDHVWNMVSKWAGGSKVAIFTTDPAAGDGVYIINEDLGKWDDAGIWWSNDSYKPYTWSTYIGTPSDKSSDTKYSDMIDAMCPTCESIPFEDASPYYCEMCLTCYDCSGIYSDTCLCWNPEKDKYQSGKRANSWGKGWEAYDYGF